jgi:thymidine kinase
MKGNCDYCGKQNKGIYTFYEGGKDTDIVVGDDNYKCVCAKCYKKYSNLGE